MSKGDRLKAAREHLGLKQRDMAERLKIAQSSYSYFEKSEAAAFSDKLMSLIIELGISLDWIMTGKGGMFLPKLSDASQVMESVKQIDLEPDVEEEGFVEEMEERIRRLKLDAMDIEDTFRRMLRRKKR